MPRLLSLVIASSWLASLCEAHGHLYEPSPIFTDPTSDPTRYCATLNGPATLPGSAYNQDPSYNADQFTQHFKASKYKTLKDLLDAYETGGECGITKLDPSNPKTLPSVVRWRHGDNEGFTPSHMGPCELWCDNTRVYQNDNCAKNIPDGSMPIDTSKCSGAKQLTMLWLALHSPEWQVYKNCVALSGANPNPSPSPTTNPTSSPSPAPTANPTSNPNPSPTPYPTNSPNPTKPSPTSASPSPTSSNPSPTVYPTNNPSPCPSTKHPTKKPTKKPTNQPTTATPSSDKVAVYYQCGGENYKGPTQCVEGSHCVYFNNYYYQCRPDSEAAEGQVAAWAQCGGKDFIGATKCVDGYTCTHMSEYYSQCRPDNKSTEDATTDDDGDDESSTDEDWGTDRRLRRV